MTIRRRSLIASSLAAGAALGAPSILRAQQTIEWTSGSPGGTWFGIVTGLANIIMEKNPDIRLRVVPGGGRDNPTKVQSGVSQLGMGIDFLSSAAIKGEEPYQGSAHAKLRSLGGGWTPAPFHVIGAANKPLDMRAALTQANLKISTTPRANSEELTLQRALAFYGNSYDKIRAQGGTVMNVSYNDQVAAFNDGRIDYLFGAAGVPFGSIIEIAEGPRATRLIPFPDDLLNHLKGLGYGAGKLPAGTYPKMQSADIPVAVLEAIVLASADVSEDLVYKITKTLIENRGRFTTIHASMKDYDPKTAWKDQPVPLHPGAAKAYRELGFMS
jgi:TRAP transporter TAXI family solute receptor